LFIMGRKSYFETNKLSLQRGKYKVERFKLILTGF